MKKVKMLMDFQGRETKERFFLKDTEVELEDHMADLLVREKRAEFVLSVGANPANEPQFEEVEPLQEEVVAQEEATAEAPELPKKRGRR